MQDTNEQGREPPSMLNPNVPPWNPDAPLSFPMYSIPPKVTQNSDVYAMSQMIGSLALPRPEVPVFGGDPMEYCTFTRSFDNLIEDKTTSDSSRLHYLVQYTTGDVQQLVKNCLTMEPTLGYSEARTLLKKRYGQSYHIAAAYVDKITKGTAIKSEDRSSLQRFSVLLTSCSNTRKSIGYMSKI